MQVANALNNHIRILFNPKVEAFKLFDFLIVKSQQDRYLAQIIEIYEDKFDASQNVAKLKLFYKVSENDEVMPYDNFTPNKECEIVRIKQEEIENFINQDKETFAFATNSKDHTPLNMQFEFFDKNPLILADKVENANTISLNLAKNLSSKKPVVIIDSTGILEFDGAKKIKAAKTFKMPLNYQTIDFVFENCLKDSSLEFQAIGTEIINEIKKFARSQEGSFIPFNGFAKVLSEQYKVTPYPELRLLLARIKKLQMDEIFARTKKDNEVLEKTIEKNPITILDLSGISSIWQRAYLEYVVCAINMEAYLITRINDETFNIDLINKIYNQKKNINFIPNVSYNYKRLPSIIQHCKNYILMPSLYQRGDFLDANFALCNLISDGCIVFGQNTDNFLYLANDIEYKAESKKGNYRRIALEMSAQKGGVDEKKPQAPIESDIINAQRAINELRDFEEQQIKNNALQAPPAKEEVEKEPEQDIFDTLLNANFEDETKEKDEFQNLVNKEDEYKEQEKAVEEVKNEAVAEEKKDEPAESFKEIIEEASNVEETLTEESVQKAEESEEIEVIEEIEEAQEQAIEAIEAIEEPVSETIEEIEETQEIEFVEVPDEPFLLTEEQLDILEDMPQEENKPKINVLEAEIVEFGQDVAQGYETPSEKVSRKVKEALEAAKKLGVETQIIPEEPKTKEKPKSQTKPKQAPKPVEQPKVEPTQEELSDEELDFFQLAKESSINQEQQPVVIDDIEYRTQSDDKNEEKKSPSPKKASKKVKEALEAAKAVQEKEEKQEKDTKQNQKEPLQEEVKQEVELPQEPLQEEIIETQQEEFLDISDDDDDLDLLAVANQSIDNNFEEIINSQAANSSQEPAVDISDKEELPIYTETQAQQGKKTDFQPGDHINHAKYGKGVVIKTIQYEQRQLLQIDFEGSGKKLLDPNVADIQPE